MTKLLTIEEAFRLLNEDTPSDETASQPPISFKSYTYKIITNDGKLILGSFVSSGRLRYDTLGFNINAQSYGPGAMIDTTRALCFLTRADAEKFCRTYAISAGSIYISKNFDNCVKINLGGDIPVYMQAAGVGKQNQSYISPSIINNVDAQPESVEHYADPEILEKNQLRLGKEAVNANALDISRQISTYLADLVYHYSTSIGGVDIKYKIVPENPNSKISTKFKIFYVFDFENLPAPQYDVGNGKIMSKIATIPENVQAVDSNFYAFVSSSINNHYTFNFKDEYNYRGDIDSYILKMNSGYRTDGELSIILDHFSERSPYGPRYPLLQIDLKKYIKNNYSLEAIKNELKDKLDDISSKLHEDINTCFLVAEYVEQVISDLLDSEEVELSYDNFDSM